MRPEFYTGEMFDAGIISITANPQRRKSCRHSIYCLCPRAKGIDVIGEFNEWQQEKSMEQVGLSVYGKL